MPGGYKKKALNPQQRKFLRLYADCNNLASAWLSAGYKTKNRAHAATNACDFIRIHPKAKTFLANLIKKQEERLDKNADDVMRELIKIGFANIQDYLKKGNTVVDLCEIPRECAAAVESIQVDVRYDDGESKGYTEKTKFKLLNKEAALKELLNRWKGLPKQTTEINGVIGTRELTDREMAKLLRDKVIPCDDAIAS